MAATGTAKQEISELTVQDFIDATYTYHNEIDNIDNVLKKLEGKFEVFVKSLFCGGDALTFFQGKAMMKTKN